MPVWKYFLRFLTFTKLLSIFTIIFPLSRKQFERFFEPVRYREKDHIYITVHIHIFTSIALLSPSLMRLKQRDVVNIMTPGSAQTHGFTYIDCLSVLNIRPQSASGGLTPKPKKLNPDAIIILTLTRLVQ